MLDTFFCKIKLVLALGCAVAEAGQTGWSLVGLNALSSNPGAPENDIKYVF